MAEGDGRQVEWLHDLVEQIQSVHDMILKASGGRDGVHVPSLYAAAARPFHTAFGEEVYPTATKKAAALFHAIICDHPFTDGSKRTATLMAMAYLGSSEVYLSPTKPPSTLQVRMLGDVALETASDGLTVEQVASWLDRIFEPIE